MAFKHMKWLRIDFFSIPKEYSSITIRTEASEVDISILFNREQDVSMKFSIHFLLGHFQLRRVNYVALKLVHIL